MEHVEGIFEGARDIKIYYQAYLPVNDVRASVIIVHGLGEHSGRYDNVVNHLVPLGYALYGFDHIGHGKSGGEREFVEQFDDFRQTLTIFKNKVRTWQPGKPIFLLGHSMGGLIATEYLINHSGDFQGAVISAPAISVPDNISQMTVIAGKILSKLAPKMGIMALDANMISRDPQVVRAYVNDPLVHHDKTTARLSAELLEAIMSVDNQIEKISVPLIIVQGSKDALANPKGSKKLHERAGSPDKTIKIYSGLYHEVFNEPEREMVLRDVADWLDAHL
jgi:alpha-beta hydrolase superfamily lysophospholipase